MYKYIKQTFCTYSKTNAYVFLYGFQTQALVAQYDIRVCSRMPKLFRKSKFGFRVKKLE